jgi:hypothetical protein
MEYTDLIPVEGRGREKRKKQGRDSSVGITTGYGLDGPGTESRGGRGFPHTSRPALGPTQPPVQWLPDLPRGVKRPGRDAERRGHEPLSTLWTCSGL